MPTHRPASTVTRWTSVISRCVHKLLIGPESRERHVRRVGCVLRHFCLLLLGVWLGASLIDTLINGATTGKTIGGRESRLGEESKDVVGVVSVDDIELRQWLYVGVMTAHRYVETRAFAGYNTWGKHIPRVEFFVGDGQRVSTQLPLVTLPDVDDTQYPPQGKLFAMLRHMCAYSDVFHWFLRADDDVYIMYDRLQYLLVGMDPTDKIYLGQPGYGRQEDRERLQMDGWAFCMGGPGVVLSQAAMTDLCSHLHKCAHDVMTSEEDVELGRCLMRYQGVQCTTSTELANLFYHAYPGHYTGIPFTRELGNDSHIRDAITLHPVKQPHVMMSIYHHHVNNQLRQATEEMKRWQATTDLMDKTKPK